MFSVLQVVTPDDAHDIPVGRARLPPPVGPEGLGSHIRKGIERISSQPTAACPNAPKAASTRFDGANDFAE